MWTSWKEREEGVDPLTWGSWSVHSHKWFQISIPATCSTESWTWWPRPWKWRALGLGASGAVQEGVSNWSARVPAAPLEPDRTGHVVVLRCSTWLCQATAHYSSQDEQWLDRAPRLDDTYYTYFIICWKNVLIRVFYFWSKIKYVTYVIHHKNVINYLT